MNNDYSEFYIKGVIDKDNLEMINFINYLFGYDDNIIYDSILETIFFKKDYKNSDLDRLLPFSSIPKNSSNLLEASATVAIVPKSICNFTIILSFKLFLFYCP